VAPGTILLSGAGATFPSILYNRWIVAYHNNNPKVTIEYSRLGAAKGFVVFSQRTLQQKSLLISVPVILRCLTQNWSMPIITR
jgi:hypothetical protein